MRIGTDLLPYTGTGMPNWQAVTGVFATGFIPDSWAYIKKLPNWSVGGDGIEPVDGKSFLSWQPGGGWQARAVCGPWETPIRQGNLLVYCADGTGTIIATPFVQTA